MSSADDKDPFSRRIVFKVPTYMPELREELLQYAENERTKRILQLANLGLMYARANVPNQEIASKSPKPVQPKSAPKPLVEPAVQISGAAEEPSDSEASWLTADGRGPAPSVIASPIEEPVTTGGAVIHSLPETIKEGSGTVKARRPIRKPPQMTE